MIETVNIYLDKHGFLPKRAYETDAGLDLFAPKDFLIQAHCSAIIDTGVHIEIPKGYVGFLKSKSGLNVKFGITGEGVIDTGYTGSIVVKLYNHSEFPKFFGRGDKIIQLVLLPIITPQLNVVDSIDKLYGTETERGNNGFGSTGK